MKKRNRKPNLNSQRVIRDEANNISVQRYLSSMSGKLLTKDEEIDLFTRYKNGDISARKELILCNTRLVISIAKKYMAFTTMELTDLCQEGMFGLFKAIEKFDVSRGLKFSTYATFWIKQGITRAIGDKNSNIRLPIHTGAHLAKMRSAEEVMIQEVERNPSNEDLAKQLGWPMSRILLLKSTNQHTVSLDHLCTSNVHPRDGDYLLTYEDLIASNDMPIEDTVDPLRCIPTSYIDEWNLLSKGLNKLDLRERIIINLYYGKIDNDETIDNMLKQLRDKQEIEGNIKINLHPEIFSNDGTNYKTIAKYLGNISHQRISQIVQEAIGKLRSCLQNPPQGRIGKKIL